ncbi:MAG: serine/threonine-protein phosphatase [Planctomycetes bacterium]|nr:serine/threonine-protein phosphatase [Planctomycetota bacterium]
MATPFFSNSDLELAAAIHASLVVPHSGDDRFEVTTHFHPSAGIGGDYTTVLARDSERVFACISDVCGHGIAAALLATRVSSHVRSVIPRVEDPCQLASDLNAFLYEKFTSHLHNLFVTFFSVLVDFDRRSLTWAGFGHPPALWLEPEATVPRRLCSANTFLGIGPHLVGEACRMERVQLVAGGRLLLYTDGLLESKTPSGPFGFKKIESVFASSRPGKAPDDLAASADALRNGDAEDDVTIVELTFR